MAVRVCKLFAIIIVSILLGSLSYVSAETSAPTAYEVKAAFLYNFAKFVEWPDSSFTNSQTSLSICIAGEDPFGDALDAVRNKTAKGRNLVIKYISGTENMGECKILFISESEKSGLPAILRTINHKAILTVSDMQGFTGSGGMINLVKLDKRIRFKINLKAAQKGGIKISSQLLKLAAEVDDGE